MTNPAIVYYYNPHHMTLLGIYVYYILSISYRVFSIYIYTVCMWMNNHVLCLILYHIHDQNYHYHYHYLDFPQVTPLCSTSEAEARSKKELLTRTSSWSSKGGLRVHPTTCEGQLASISHNMYGSI